MASTKQLFHQMGFPGSRLTFVQNREQKYATYNIVNAAYNFCNAGEIQVIVDGDDQLIGRYAFKLLNTFYQRYSHIWIAYTNFHASVYTPGTSRPIRSDDYLLGPEGKRLSRHYIGPIRSWKVNLIRRVPLEHHQFRNGTWFDTLYDDAIQHPLFELARHKRIKYIA